jgi:hypothetical protein
MAHFKGTHSNNAILVQLAVLEQQRWQAEKDGEAPRIAMHHFLQPGPSLLFFHLDCRSQWHV